MSGLQSPVPHDNSASASDQNVNETDLQFVGPPLLDDAVESSDTPAERTSTAGSNFRGIPIDVPEAATRVPRPRFDDEVIRQPEHMSRTTYRAIAEPRGPRGCLAFQADDGGTPRTQYSHVSACTMNSHAPITYGAESFEDYMRQFMSSEVRYKDFQKTIVQKYDSSRQDSFIHWYKLFCAYCLQWGLWCPPYESIEQDNIHGSWWPLLPASVRAQDTFMSSLLYGVLSQETVFPVGSKEHSAVQGCTANAGYDAIYSLLRLHHPSLQTAIQTVNEIPRQRRAELFSSYLRRLQDFLARERIAGRNYSEYEALDLSVRNLANEWRSEFRRLVERDRRTGRAETSFPSTSPCLSSPPRLSNIPSRLDATSRRPRHPTRGIATPPRPRSYVALKPLPCLLRFSPFPPKFWENKKWIFSSVPCHKTRPTLPHAWDVDKPAIP